MSRLKNTAGREIERKRERERKIVRVRENLFTDVRFSSSGIHKKIVHASEHPAAVDAAAPGAPMHFSFDGRSTGSITKRGAVSSQTKNCRYLLHSYHQFLSTLSFCINK